MNRFVRTKDGIYEVVFKDLKGTVDENEKCILVKGKNSFIEYFLMKKDIIKQADTIWELCDEFVGLVKSADSDFISMRVIAHSLKELKESLKAKLLNGEVYEGNYDIIYGVIWTDKGLIYVAKMNDKGDFELI